jgi:hypothetical protein
VGEIGEVRETLLAAERNLGELAQALSPGYGDPEELGMLMRAEMLETESDNLLAQASGEDEEERKAYLIRRAEELAREAAQIRHLATDTLQQRAAAATESEGAAKSIRGQIEKAVRTATPADDITAQIAFAGKEAGEVKDKLFAASAGAADREQTRQCAGLVLDAQERSGLASLACQVAQNLIFEYVARL